ncbi:hypothetical protein CH380_08165 [Leptospira adleri]|uniref:Lipoprotein n=2 Tax=Leptospira adleri TaxID=2023186 RepID=A0A2M9YR04_9LEPT|nr:hypothetical protein CH380_08165 [Leptospira adleri]
MKRLLILTRLLFLLSFMACTGSKTIPESQRKCDDALFPLFIPRADTTEEEKLNVINLYIICLAVEN